MISLYTLVLLLSPMALAISSPPDFGITNLWPTYITDSPEDAQSTLSTEYVQTSRSTKPASSVSDNSEEETDQ